MYLVNDGRVPKYSGLANKTVPSGGRTRDLDVFSASYRQIKDSTRGFRVVLSDSDLSVLREIIRDWVESTPKDKAAGMTAKSVMDKAVSDLVARRKTKQAAMAMKMDMDREKERRINAESNFLDESGNPVNDKIIDKAVREDIKPELHPEMDNDLSKVLANNLAIMTTASGKPIENKPGVVAGSTDVPTDPKWYQDNRSDLPPGMPDFESSRNIMKSIMGRK